MKYLIKVTTVLLLLALTLILVSCNPLDLLALARQVPLLNGITWSGHRLVLDTADMPDSCDNWLMAPTVIKDGDTYKMWFGGRDSSFTTRVHYSESTDGLNWNLPVVVIDAGAEGTYDTAEAAMPTVLKEGGIYKMWYVGSAESSRKGMDIGYATSKDGIHWERYSGNPVIDNTKYTVTAYGIYAPFVLYDRDEGLYKMWFTAQAKGGCII